MIVKSDTFVSTDSFKQEAYLLFDLVSLGSAFAEVQRSRCVLLRAFKLFGKSKLFLVEEELLFSLFDKVAYTLP